MDLDTGDDGVVSVGIGANSLLNQVLQIVGNLKGTRGESMAAFNTGCW